MRTLSIILLFVATVTYAQQSDTRNLSSFDAIDVSEGIKVILESGNPEARVEVTGADVEDVVTEVSANTLNIEMRGDKNYRNVNVTVYVKFERIEEIDVSSAADVVFESKITGSVLDVDISSAGYLRADMEVKALNVDISSSGKTDLSGSADEMEVDISSAGSMDAKELVSQIADVEVTSAGSATINVTKELRAEANSAGKVTYKGNPEKVFADSNSGGKVRKY
jgi:hypothetical protein